MPTFRVTCATPGAYFSQLIIEASDGIDAKEIAQKALCDTAAVILVQADMETAGAKAETLRKVIEDQPMNLGDWSAPIRVSYGIRPVEPGMDPETALAEADAAMFVRKKARA